MKLRSAISLEQVQAFRGVIDFYYWKGIPIARQWPRKPRHPGSPKQVATWNAFREMMKWRKAFPTSLVLDWRSMNLPIGRSAEDQMRKYGLRMAYKHQLTIPPEVTKVECRQSIFVGYTDIVITIANIPDLELYDINWLCKGYIGAGNGLEWFIKSQQPTRQGTLLPQYEALTSGFTRKGKSPNIVYGTQWLITLTGTFDSIECMPIADFPEQEGNLLGPLYSAFKI